MNRQQTVQLVGIIRAICPTQKWDEMTPDAWSIVMTDIRYDDAQQAVTTIYRDRGNDTEYGGRRIEADDIIREVRRIRERRLAEHPPIDPPDTIRTGGEYRAWLRTTRQAIADGAVITQPALPAHDMTPLRQLVGRLPNG